MTAKPPCDLPSISVVFVTYKRLQTLRPTIETFLRVTDYPRERLELIVTDDGSPPADQAALGRLGFDRVVVSSARSGLGANVNRGLAACSHGLIVQLQDDWACNGPPDYLRQAVRILTSHPQIGLLSFNELPRSDLPSRRSGHVRIFANRPAEQPKVVEDAAYSDWPHIKRREFIEVIGPYKEGVLMAEMELAFSRAVNSQERWRIADVPGWAVFAHIGEHLSYNKTWKSRLVTAFRALPGGSAMHDRYELARRPGRGSSR